MKTIIFGTTDFAEMMYIYLKENNEDVDAFTVNKKYLPSKDMPCRVIPFEDLELYYSVDEVEILPAVGYLDMNDRRKSIFCQIKNKGYKIRNFIHPSAIISKSARYDYGTIILENSVIQSNVMLGEGNIIFSNATISHNSNVGDFNWFAPGFVSAGNVTIENNCFLGSNATIRNGITIKEYSMIGAGSYVYKDTTRRQLVKPCHSVYLENEDIDRLNRAIE